MRRREFIAGLGSAAAWPVVARAQQVGMPVIGFLHAGSRGPVVKPLLAFLRGLGEAGFVEGQNVDIEYRFADGQFDRLPALATELVQRRVSVIVALPGSPAASAAKAATATIPIVFSSGIDPVRLGFVASFNRPGGNMTGVFGLGGALGGKQLEMLRRLVPGEKPIAFLINPTNTNAEPDWAEILQAARAMGQKLIVLEASSDQELDAAFASLVRQQAAALFLYADPFFTSRRPRIAGLALRHSVPAMGEIREYAESGLLMSYGTGVADSFHQVGVYAGRILRGERPADLPLVQPSKIELVINLKTAKAIGIDIPPTLLALADDVIE
jgi:putative tryptophan/tyrosine transport system substrate-binding protein